MTGVKIQVVEDEILVAKHIEALLERAGYTVCSLETNGPDAIEAAGRNHPHLVLMDISLDGEMDGIEAAEQIWVKFGIPIVYLTAYSDKDTLDRAVLTASFGYLVKPVNADQLRATVEVALFRA